MITRRPWPRNQRHNLPMPQSRDAGARRNRAARYRRSKCSAPIVPKVVRIVATRGIVERPAHGAVNPRLRSSEGWCFRTADGRKHARSIAYRASAARTTRRGGQRPSRPQRPSRIGDPTPRATAYQRAQGQHRAQATGQALRELLSCDKFGLHALGRRKYCELKKPPILRRTRERSAYASRRAGSISPTSWGAWAYIPICRPFRLCLATKSAVESTLSPLASTRTGSVKT